LLDRTGEPDRVTIRGVAAEVGVAPTALYLHFADRDELMVAVVEERFAEFRRSIDAADPGGDPLDALVARGVAYVEFALAHPGHYRALFGGFRLSEERPDLAARCQAAGAPAFEALIEAVQRCLDAGRLQGSDPYPIAVGLWSMTHGYADLVRSGCGPMLRDVRTVLEAVVSAFRPVS
jgi:AcrR family transcriptional regulator